MVERDAVTAAPIHHNGQIRSPMRESVETTYRSERVRRSDVSCLGKGTIHRQTNGEEGVEGEDEEKVRL